MKKTTLKLARETLRVLTNVDLAGAAGGIITEPRSEPCATGQCPTHTCPPPNPTDACISTPCHTGYPECVVMM